MYFIACYIGLLDNDPALEKLGKKLCDAECENAGGEAQMIDGGVD